MKVAFHTLGCKVNSYETQAIAEQFTALGFDVVEYHMPADVYVINTCSVTAEASRKSRQILNRAKKTNPQALTVATGCYAQEDAGRLAGSADLIIGNNEKSRIAQLVLQKLEEQRPSEVTAEPLIFVNDLTRCYTYEEQKISSQGSHVRAYVKIQDGCNRFCSYCIIPYLRGRSRSRKQAEILEEAERLSDAGYKEIVLTGIDISDYHSESGNDIPGGSLLSLLKALDRVQGIERIRLGSLEEGILTETFVKEAADLKHLCPQFHLSLQSGSDPVLQRMNRKYTTAEYRETVRLLRECFELPAVTTDIIAGFPGETGEEFEETCRFAEEIGFAGIHVFKYSRRAGTVANRMENQLTDREKTVRSERLLRLAEKTGAAYRQAFSGKTREVLFEERFVSENATFYTGFTPEYFKVRMPSEEDLINRIIPVTISPDLLTE